MCFCLTVNAKLPTKDLIYRHVSKVTGNQFDNVDTLLVPVWQNLLLMIQFYHSKTRVSSVVRVISGHGAEPVNIYLSTTVGGRKNCRGQIIYQTCV
jgi:hypothetical protein